MDNQPPVVQPQTLPPAPVQAPVPAPLPAAPSQNRRKAIFMIVFLLILGGSLFGVYSWQHGQLKTTQKDLAATKKTLATTQKQNTAQKDEFGQVDTSRFQSVFLTNGQTYFGKLTFLNKDAYKLTDIFYLQTAAGTPATTSNAAAGANANTSVSLVKLGCELHKPDDKMIINRGQIQFWENLKTDGQVSQAISTYQKQNPNGQKCAS